MKLKSRKIGSLFVLENEVCELLVAREQNEFFFRLSLKKKPDCRYEIFSSGNGQMSEEITYAGKTIKV